MDSKFTKATRHLSIGRPSKKTGLAKSIAKPSAELKSTSQLFHQHKRGLDAEKCVEDFLAARGYQTKLKRSRTPYGELDLLVESPKGGWVLIEVKCLSRVDWMENRIQNRQLKRLCDIRLYLESKFDVEVSLWAAIVMNQKISFQPLL